MAANRVMKSVTSWLERKLFLKVSASKTKVVRPTKSKFLGFTFWKNENNGKSQRQFIQILIKLILNSIMDLMKKKYIKLLIQGWVGTKGVV